MLSFTAFGKWRAGEKPQSKENYECTTENYKTKDGNIGIEVTSAIPQEEREALTLASEIPYIEEEKQKRRIAYLKKRGYEYTKYGMLHPFRSYGWIGLNYPDIEKTFCIDFIHAVEKKIQKLNSKTYNVLYENDLFVQSELYIEEWMPQKLIDKLCQLSTKQYSYKFIYLLALNGLFVFNIPDQKYSMKETGEKLWGLGNVARDMVEKGEMDFCFESEFENAKGKIESL